MIRVSAVAFRSGPAAVAARITDLRDWLIAGLRERGCPIIGAPHARGPSGIVSFLPPDGDAAAAHRRLDRGGIVLSRRDAPDGRRVLRAAPHYYHSEPEIDRLVGEL